jgi:hypothetical protein
MLVVCRATKIARGLACGNMFLERGLAATIFFVRKHTLQTKQNRIILRDLRSRFSSCRGYDQTFLGTSL